MKPYLGIILIVLSSAILFWNQGTLDRYHAESGLNRMASADNVPPTLALTTFVLGPMRSLAVDVLWWRAIQQQDAGRYYDAMQLADWITKLQPTYSSVWVFHGWNMSFNISADFATAEDSWRWIDRSIRLLRDEGLRYNPDDRHIRHELARIFYDKIGGKNDVHSDYYRRRWAYMMRDYFHIGTRDELITLAAAPKNKQELLERPWLVKYQNAALRRGIDIFDFETNKPNPFPLKNLDLDAATARNAASELYRSYRRMRIEKDLKLDPDRMLMIDREYGPLDWRLHQAHAIYWVAEDSWEDFSSKSVNYAHIIRQSMMDSFRDGKMLTLPGRNEITYTNNLEIIDRIHQYMEVQLREHYTLSMDSSHKSFLKLAVTVLYNYNRTNAARVVYEHYVEDYYRGQKVPSFEEFVIQSMRDSTKIVDSSEARTFIEASLYESYKWIEFREYDRSNGAMALARLMYKRNQLRNPNKPLPPFDHLVAAARKRYTSKNKIEDSSMSNAEKVMRGQEASEIEIDSFGGSHERPEGAILPDSGPMQGPLPQ